MAESSDDAVYGTTIGERLRVAREARGLTLDDVANETRIPIRHLRSIEDANWEDLPAVTYTIGFARSYANAVGLDGPELARELRDQLGGQSRPATVSPEIYAAPDPARVPSRSLAWGAAILLVVLIAAWLLVIRPYLTRSDTETAAPATANETAAPPAQTAEPQPPVAPTSVAGQQVTLVATNDAWISVTDRDAANQRLYRDNLRAGQRFDVPIGAGRPVVFTAAPQNVRILIGGQDRGLLSLTQRRINNQSLKAEDLATLLAQQPPGAAPTGAPAAPAPATQGNGFRPML